MSPTSDLVARYLSYRKRAGELAPKSVANVRTYLYRWDTFIGGRSLSVIGRADVERWLLDLATLSPATRRHALSALRQLYRWALIHGHVRADPTTSVRGPRDPRRLPRAVRHDDVTAVLDACPDVRARLIVTLAVQEGMRCIEIVRLEVGDIDRHAGTLRVVGKGGHERLLPLLADTQRALDDYLAEYPAPGHGPLVRSFVQDRQALTSGAVSRLVSGWFTDAGVKHAPRDGMSAHALRHTCATDMLLAGAHLRDVQAALGHKHLQTTEVYLPTVVRGLESAMEGRSYR